MANKIFGVILIIVGIFLLIGAGAYGLTSIFKGNGGSGLFGTPGKKVVCNVLMDNDFFSDSDIESADCNAISDCNANSLFSFKSGLLFKDELTLKLTGSDGYVYATKSDKLNSWDDVEVTLTACIPQSVSSGRLDLIQDTLISGPETADQLEVSW